MFKRTRISSAILAGTVTGVLATLAAPAAFAQERVEITGSRIKTTQTEGTSPVISLSAETIKVEAVSNVESLLNNLPAVFADYGGQVSNGSTGTATVNLRNLGRDRTLVLINGRRVPAGSPRAVAADLNQIPVSLVKRVDILSGGASAVYGADAVAGVVNFIMNDRFEGLQLQANGSFFQHGQQNPSDVNSALNARGFKIPGDKSSDGQSKSFDITLGGNFANGKGNAVTYFGFKRDDALLQSERDFTACSAATTVNTLFRCGGSSTSFPGRFILNNGSATVADATGTVRPFVAASDLFNFGPINYLQRPSDRFTSATFVRYDINPMARVYLEASFHDDHTVAQIAPSGLFGFDASGANAVRFDNPLLSASWKARLHSSNQAGDPATNFLASGDTADVLILRRNVEGGGRQDDLRHTSYRFVTGVKGEVGPVSYDLFAQQGRVVYQETYKNDFSIARTARALDVVRDGNGNIVCRSVMDGSDPNCVPYNIWSLNAITPAALGYISTPGFQKGFTSQRVWGGNASIDLSSYGIKMPTAKTGVSLSAGYEQRSEFLQLDTDTAFTTGDLAGQGGPTIGVAGGYTVKDFFTEIDLPLLEDMPLAKLLNLKASYRNSSYSTGPKTDTYGVGMRWEPVRQVSLRGSYQRAVRAPNVVELFNAQSLGLYNMTSDPCAGPTPSSTLVQCARTGVTAAQYGNIVDSAAGQYNQITGGNPRLKPETADSVTLGVVLQPVKDVDITLDYFSIKLKDTVGNVPAPTTLRECLNTGNAVFCNLIQRDSRGTLWATPQANIQAGNANLGKTTTEGVDLGANYRFGLGGMGRLDLSLLGTWLKKLQYEPVPGLGTFDCVGLWGNGNCGTPSPEWRHKLRTTWTTPWNLDLTFTWRYIGKVADETTSSNPQLSGPINTWQAHWGAQNYFDLAAKYDLTKNLTLRMAVNNLLDKDPPIGVTGAPFGNGNTFPVVYDAMGRKFSFNLVASF